HGIQLIDAYCMSSWLCTSAYNFFFQAEDGIRDRNVTGVQTCALPILYYCNNLRSTFCRVVTVVQFSNPWFSSGRVICEVDKSARSEERRVGKEWRWKWWAEG